MQIGSVSVRTHTPNLCYTTTAMSCFSGKWTTVEVRLFIHRPHQDLPVQLNDSNLPYTNMLLISPTADTLRPFWRTRWPAYRGEAAAHVSIGDGEAGLVDGLLKDQVDDPFEPLFCVDGQVRHLLHQLVEFLRRQLVQDAAYLPEQLLKGIGCKRKKQLITWAIVLDISPTLLFDWLLLVFDKYI